MEAFDDIGALTALLARRPLHGARVYARKVAPSTWRVAGVIGLRGAEATGLDVGRRLRAKALAAAARKTERRGGALLEVRC